MALSAPPSTVIPVENSILSIELWAASKILGRECSHINLEYFQCKQAMGDDPKACKHHGKFVRACPEEILGVLYSKFPEEFKSYQKCLDLNDYRYVDCRKTERALLDCWNKHMDYVAN